MGSIVRNKITRADLASWNGVTPTVTRQDATGGTVTGLMVGNEVDVLQVYGSGTDRTRASIASAISNISSSSNATLVFAPGTWTIDDNLTIASNFTCHVPAGCVFSVDSGKTLTFSGFVNVEHTTWTSGSGTVVVSKGPSPSVPGDVRLYGAVGDGVADDSAAIQSAISVMAEGRGGIVFFPALKFNLGTTGISIPAGEHGIRLVGQASGFTNDEGPASTELSYTGTGTAISIGGSSSRTDYAAIENIAVNITGAGAAASCLTATRTQHLGLINAAFLTSQGAASATGQTAIIFDGGADFSAYTLWSNSKIRGDFTKGIVNQNGQINAMTFIGGSILQTCSGTPASTIGIDDAVAASSSTSYIGTDFDGWDKALKIASDRNTIIARFESGGNTVDVEFLAGADKNFLGGGVFDPAKVTNSGANNIILSPDYFTFTATGRIGVNSTPDYRLDIRDTALVAAQVKATDANGVARYLVGNGDRTHEMRCHSDDSGMIRDATADVTKIMWDTNGTTVYTLKTDVVATGSLPTGAAAQDGRILVEDAGAGDRNLVIYAGGQRFRIDGGAAF